MVRTMLPRPLRNWLRHPGRSLEYLALKIGNRWKPSAPISIRDGWSVSSHALSRKHFEVFSTDPIQAEELDSFIENCPVGIRLLDIGAHHGFFALAAAHYGGGAARILCVEASPSAAAILEENLRSNGIESQTIIKNFAIGDCDGMLPMLTTGPLGGDYFVIPTEARVDTVMVRQVSIASLLRDTGFSPTHLKIDIEGFEYEVLGAAVEVLERLKPVIFLELHGSQIADRQKDPGEVIRCLQAAGYKSFEIGGNDISMDEMRRRNFNCRMICRP